MFLPIFFICLSQTIGQLPATSIGLKLLGTRSWIRLDWNNSVADEKGYNIYWALLNERPDTPQAFADAGTSRYYIQNVEPEQNYFVWVEPLNATGRNKFMHGEIFTSKQWTLNPEEANQLDIPSSAAVPEGMKLFWHDEFNDKLLNRNKWSTNYYSSIDYLYKINFNKMKADSLPQPSYTLNGKTINLFTNDSLPAEVYDLKNNKKYHLFRPMIGQRTKTCWITVAGGILKYV